MLGPSFSDLGSSFSSGHLTLNSRHIPLLIGHLRVSEFMLPISDNSLMNPSSRICILIGDFSKYKKRREEREEEEENWF